MSKERTIILSILVIVTQLIAIGFFYSDNKKIKTQNDRYLDTIDSLKMEIKQMEFHYSEYDILFEELDSTTLEKIDSVLKNIE